VAGAVVDREGEGPPPHIDAQFPPGEGLLKDALATGGKSSGCPSLSRA
jgi:hypothetical protein